VVDKTVRDSCTLVLRGHSVQAKRAGGGSGGPLSGRRWQQPPLLQHLSPATHPPTTTLFWARLLTRTVKPTFLRAGPVLEVRKTPYLQPPTHTRRWSGCPPWSGARTSPRVVTGRTGPLRTVTGVGRRSGEILWVSKGLNCARGRLVRVCALRPVVGSFRGRPSCRLYRGPVKSPRDGDCWKSLVVQGRVGGGRKRNENGGSTGTQLTARQNRGRSD